MRLTKEEQAMLDGAGGSAPAKAMEILLALGTIYEAERMAPVTSVQIAGVSYDNLGESGLKFLTEMATRRRHRAGADHPQPGRHGHRQLAPAGNRCGFRR